MDPGDEPPETFCLRLQPDKVIHASRLIQRIGIGFSLPDRVGGQFHSDPLHKIVVLKPMIGGSDCVIAAEGRHARIRHIGVRPRIEHIVGHGVGAHLVREQGIVIGFVERFGFGLRSRMMKFQHMLENKSDRRFAGRGIGQCEPPDMYADFVCSDDLSVRGLCFYDNPRVSGRAVLLRREFRENRQRLSGVKVKRFA